MLPNEYFSKVVESMLQMKHPNLTVVQTDKHTLQFNGKLEASYKGGTFWIDEKEFQDKSLFMQALIKSLGRMMARVK